MDKRIRLLIKKKTFIQIRKNMKKKIKNTKNIKLKYNYLLN